MRGGSQPDVNSMKAVTNKNMNQNIKIFDKSNFITYDVIVPNRLSLANKNNPNLKTLTDLSNKSELKPQTQSATTPTEEVTKPHHRNITTSTIR